jgi:hypothetical protein
MVHQNPEFVKSKIDTIETTTEKFSGRAGLAPVSRYLEKSGITSILANRFNFLKKHAKGTPLVSIFHQLLCFFF